MTYDSINPAHYKDGRKHEPIEVIEEWELNYNLGNALKYIARNGRKPGEDPAEGLKKAIWYLEREVQKLQGFLETPQHSENVYQAVKEDYEREYQGRNYADSHDNSIDYTGQAEWTDFYYTGPCYNYTVLGDK